MATIVCGIILLVLTVMGAIILSPALLMVFAASDPSGDAAAIFISIFCLLMIGIFWILCGALKNHKFAFISLVFSLINLLVAFKSFPFSYVCLESGIVFAAACIIDIFVSDRARKENSKAKKETIE